VVIWFGALNHKEYKQRSIISEKVTEAGQTKLITVDVTYPNVRIKGDVVPSEHDTEPNIYVPRHSLIEVSSNHYVLYLNVIYPHIVEKIPEYFLSLQASVQKTRYRLHLLTVGCNEHPHGVNMFTLHQDMPTDHMNAATALKHCPIIFLLLRGSDIEESVEGVFQQFKQLATNNPMSAIIKNAHQQFIYNECILFSSGAS
jgi:hypothetical protein